MNYDKLTGLVQNRAQLSSRGDAVGAIRATLETLAERIDPNEAAQLASQLPKEIAYYLNASLTVPQRFSFGQFCQRVAIRENVDLVAATQHAHAVFEVLQEAVSSGEIRDVRSQ